MAAATVARSGRRERDVPRVETRWVWLFGLVYVGAGNIASNPDEAVLAMDTRFARLTQPAFAGLTMPANSSTQLSFSLVAPATVERTNYMGNCVLFQASWHDKALYLDRGLFVFGVT